MGKCGNFVVCVDRGEVVPAEYPWIVALSDDMVTLGEEAGSLGALLDRTADCYEQVVTDAMGYAAWCNRFSSASCVWW